jgi:hypothetical protein
MDSPDTTLRTSGPRLPLWGAIYSSALLTGAARVKNRWSMNGGCDGAEAAALWPGNGWSEWLEEPKQAMFQGETAQIMGFLPDDRSGAAENIEPRPISAWS